jgi:hypothetical protein
MPEKHHLFAEAERHAVGDIAELGQEFTAFCIEFQIYPLCRFMLRRACTLVSNTASITLNTAKLPGAPSTDVRIRLR